ncbi:hypothetical protein B0J17DRAFT_27729 [Rhizoctonia solani]|nr:hypothetical protein B0J17DRAFT_27729 [Rhizoctonia solani]
MIYVNDVLRIYRRYVYTLNWFSAYCSGSMIALIIMIVDKFISTPLSYLTDLACCMCFTGYPYLLYRLSCYPHYMSLPRVVCARSTR